MDNLAIYLPFITAGLSALAALFAVLAFLRSGGGSDGSASFAPQLRDEADRIKADTAEQARGIRREVGDNIRGFQDSFSQKLDTGIEALRAPVTAIGQKLDQDMAKMELEAAESREALRLAIEAKLDASGARTAAASRELREELTGNFKQTADLLASTLQQLGVHQRERLDKVATELAAMSAQQTIAQDALRQTVEGRLDALRTENSAKLDEMRKTVDEKLQTTLEKRLGESFRHVSEQLERVHAGLGEMQNLATGVGDLKKVLTNVKTRGTWGEVQLGMLLEQFLSPEQFIRNAQVKKESAERVEFAIRFVGKDIEEELLLPIDAKFPQEDYERLVHAAERADATAVEEASAALEIRVRSFAKSISDKYINPPITTDFAILFLPTESLFAEVLRRPGLFEHLQREYRVTLAGPTTLASILNAFQMGFRSLAIQQRSSEVWQILGAVRSEFKEHGRVVERLKKQLGAATNTIDALGTRTRAMNRKLKDVEVLSDGSASTLLGLTAQELADAEPDEADEIDVDQTA